MIKTSRSSFFIVLLVACSFLFVPLFSQRDSKRIDADHPGFQYVGRIDFSESKQPYLSWPGTMVKAKFTGESLSVILDDDAGENYFNVIIDGNLQYPVVVDCEPGVHSYPVGYGLSNEEHQVVIYKRTEGHEGGTRFLGIEIDDDAKMMEVPMRLERRIEIYGDSITCGMGNEAADNARDDLSADKNQYLAYSGFVARILDAETHVIAKSGIGIMISWFDFTMPDYYDQLTAESNNDSKWDFTSWIPDVVVINLFQNDSWLVEKEKRLQPEPSDEQIIDAYQAFLDSVREKYPKETLFVCALGSMDATREGCVWPGYIERAVSDLKNSDPHARIKTCFFKFNGYERHPRVKQHRDNAKQLSEVIAREMNWEIGDRVGHRN